MTKAIFFDMDGTLFQTTSILGEALHYTFDILREEGQWTEETPLETYYEIMGVPLPVVWEKLCPTFSDEQRMRCNGIFHEQLIKAIRSGKGKLYEDVHVVLEALQKCYTLFVTSNGEVEYLRAIVESLQIQSFFKEVYSIQQIDSLNKGLLVRKAMQQHGITEGFVVGDRLSDIQAAKQNNLTAIGVQFDFAQQHELEQADYVVQNLKALLPLLEV